MAVEEKKAAYETIQNRLKELIEKEVVIPIKETPKKSYISDDNRVKYIEARNAYTDALKKELKDKVPKEYLEERINIVNFDSQYMEVDIIKEKREDSISHIFNSYKSKEQGSISSSKFISNLYPFQLSEQEASEQGDSEEKNAYNLFVTFPQDRKKLKQGVYTNILANFEKTIPAKGTTVPPPVPEPRQEAVVAVVSSSTTPTPLPVPQKQPASKDFTFGKKLVATQQVVTQQVATQQVATQQGETEQGETQQRIKRSKPGDTDQKKPPTTQQQPVYMSPFAIYKMWKDDDPHSYEFLVFLLGFLPEDDKAQLQKVLLEQFEEYDKKYRPEFEGFMKEKDAEYKKSQSTRTTRQSETGERKGFDTMVAYQASKGGRRHITPRLKRDGRKTKRRSK